MNKFLIKLYALLLKNVWEEEATIKKIENSGNPKVAESIKSFLHEIQRLNEIHEVKSVEPMHTGCKVFMYGIEKWLRHGNEAKAIEDFKKYTTAKTHGLKCKCILSGEKFPMNVEQLLIQFEVELLSKTVIKRESRI